MKNRQFTNYGVQFRFAKSGNFRRPTNVFNPFTAIALFILISSVHVVVLAQDSVTILDPLNWKLDSFTPGTPPDPNSFSGAIYNVYNFYMYSNYVDNCPPTPIPSPDWTQAQWLDYINNYLNHICTSRYRVSFTLSSNQDPTFQASGIDLSLPPGVVVSTTPTKITSNGGYEVYGIPLGSYVSMKISGNLSDLKCT